MPFKYAVSPAESDLDIAHGQHAKEVLEKHWDEWIQEEEWTYMKDHGINSVRVPVCRSGITICVGQIGAWARLTRAISKAAEEGIGVLLDLHAAPGKQNYDAHAGTSGPPNFFGDPHNQRRTITALKVLVTHLKTFTQSFAPPLKNIIGIELLNEPAPPSDQSLKKWYQEAINEIRSIDPEIPIYLGDCWRPETYADFISDITGHKRLEPPMVIDHHLYRCFTQSDIRTPAPVHVDTVRDYSFSIARKLATAAEMVGRASGGLVVGEWSAAMNPGSLSGSFADQRDQQREWVAAQIALYDRVCSGWFFWTYKNQSKGDVSWSWRDAVEVGVFPNFVGVRKREGFTYNRDDISSQQALTCAKKVALDRHIAYWGQYPGEYNHARFSAGYIQGWHDALCFLSSETRPPFSDIASQLGLKAAWARKTTDDRGKSYWEYEAGFMQAVDSAVEWYSQDL